MSIHNYIHKKKSLLKKSSDDDECVSTSREGLVRSKDSNKTYLGTESQHYKERESKSVRLDTLLIERH